MLGQMRRSHRTIVRKSCPCGGMCTCHDTTDVNVGWLVLLVVFPIGVLLALLLSYHGNDTRYIEVNGEMCEIGYKHDWTSSTGAAHGHDIAVCKKDNK